MIATERLYLTADGRIVREGDPAATSLLVGQGGTVPPEHEAAVEAFSAPVEEKAEKPVSNKAVTPAANKAKKK